VFEFSHASYAASFAAAIQTATAWQSAWNERRSESNAFLMRQQGLVQDAFLMAASGCEVTAIERSPLVFALLEDALLRAQLTGGSFAVIASRLTLQQGRLPQSGCPATPV
jgi:16S rRNA (guanine1516-N2)-methyltransferase